MEVDAVSAELKELVAQFGMDVQSWGEDCAWVRVESGRCRLYTLSSLRELAARSRRWAEMASPCPAMHCGMHEYPNGQSKWISHGKDRANQTFVLSDYADEVGRKHWKDYVVLPDGREGPRPFSSKAEQRDYEQLTGQRAVTPDERKAPQRSEVDKFAEHAKKRLVADLAAEHGEATAQFASRVVDKLVEKQNRSSNP